MAQKEKTTPRGRGVARFREERPEGRNAPGKGGVLDASYPI
jgi:hypothetical protein